EELLVITDDNAYWLDDDLPHVRRWRRRQAERAQAVASVRAAA
ncbi:Xaa-Pro aminopeptidase, partial [Burkholderia territorii]